MPADLEFSMTSWGSPAAPKRALLLHGMQGCGTVFFKVAAYLVEQGYRVDAPDLLGHGWAPRLPASSRYTIPALASHLASHLSSPSAPSGSGSGSGAERYDIIAGVSFGSTLILPLLSLLPSHLRPTRAVLVEPILDMPPPPAERIAGMVAGAQEPPSEETIQAQNPLWDAKECLIRRMCVMQLDARLVGELFEEVANGNLSHSLIPSAQDLPETELIILAGDPAIRSVYPASNAALLKSTYPHVRFGRRLGASHDMHKDKPEVVAAVIINGLDVEGVEVLA